MQRPPSITAAAWVIIALGAEAIAGSLSSMIRNAVLSQVADPHLGVTLTAQLGALLQVGVIACGAFMLRGMNWARIAYVVLTGFMLLGVVVLLYRVSGMGFLAVYAVAKAAVLLYVLFRPEANAYFAGAASRGGESSSPIQQTDA
jgi:hypothetical protein